MQGHFIHKGGIFDAVSSPADYFGQQDRVWPRVPGRNRLSFRWLGPFGGLGQSSAEWAQAPCDDYRPYMETPNRYDAAQWQSAIVPEQVYGREAGPFYNSPRRCPVNLSAADVAWYQKHGRTPRGGIFDGATVGGPACSFLDPFPLPIAMNRPPQVMVPTNSPPPADVPFSGCCGGFGVGPDGIG